VGGAALGMEPESRALSHAEVRDHPTASAAAASGSPPPITPGHSQGRSPVRGMAKVAVMKPRPSAP
jgi:hypothetical protein